MRPRKSNLRTSRPPTRRLRRWRRKTTARVEAAEIAADGFDSGTGTQDDPFVVRTAGQLAYLSVQVSSGATEFEGQTIVLDDDIDLSGVLWAPVGVSAYSPSAQFKGTFDGRGHTIRNLYADGSGHVGLFGYAYQATIANVAVEGAVKSRGGTTAGLVAQASSTRIEGCVSRVEVSGAGYDGVGGIAGFASGDTAIVKCGNEGNVASSYASNAVMEGVGGIVGYNKSAGSIERCYNAGGITSYCLSVGGIVGYNSEWELDVADCTNEGPVTSRLDTAKYNNPPGVGGITGRNQATYAKLRNCVNLAPVKAEESCPYVGGIIGNTTSMSWGADKTTGLSNNYSLGASGCRAIGANKMQGGSDDEAESYSYDAEGAAETVSEARMQSAELLAVLGGSYEAGPDGFPWLAWRNPDKRYAVTFDIRRDTEANAGASAPVMTLCDVQGGKIEPEPDGHFDLLAGIYSYQVEQRGYATATGSVNVSGDDVEVAVVLQAIAYRYTLRVSPADAEVVVKSGDEAKSPTAVERSGDGATYAFDLYNGAYQVSVRKFRYTPAERTVNVLFEDAQDDVALSAVPTFDTHIQIEAPAANEAASHGPRVDVYEYDPASQSKGELVFTNMDDVGQTSAYTTLPAGDYVAVANAAGCATGEQWFTVFEAANVRVRLAAHGSWSGEADDSLLAAGPADGSYVLYTPEQLAAFSQAVGEGRAFDGETVRLAGDVDVSGHPWQRIGSSRANLPFSGAFDGEGHTVGGLTVDVSDENHGLFGFVDGGAVKNVTVTGSVATSSTFVSTQGGIVGHAKDALVENCVNKSAVAGGGTVGGIVGLATSTTGETLVTRCYNAGAVGGAIEAAGGIAGALGGSSGERIASIESCYNVGEVASTAPSGADAASNAGGLVGVAASQARIANSYNAGVVGAQHLDGTGYSKMRAGIVGRTLGLRVNDAAYVSNNFTIPDGEGSGEFSFAISGGSKYDVEGAGETRAASAMKTAEFAELLSDAYALTSDASAAYYNGGFPLPEMAEPRRDLRGRVRGCTRRGRQRRLRRRADHACGRGRRHDAAHGNLCVRASGRDVFLQGGKARLCDAHRLDFGGERSGRRVGGARGVALRLHGGDHLLRCGIPPRQGRGKRGDRARLGGCRRRRGDLQPVQRLLHPQRDEVRLRAPPASHRHLVRGRARRRRPRAAGDGGDRDLGGTAGGRVQRARRGRGRAQRRDGRGRVRLLRRPRLRRQGALPLRRGASRGVVHLPGEGGRIRFRDRPVRGGRRHESEHRAFRARGVARRRGRGDRRARSARRHVLCRQCRRARGARTQGFGRRELRRHAGRALGRCGPR